METPIPQRATARSLKRLRQAETCEHPYSTMPALRALNRSILLLVHLPLSTSTEILVQTGWGTGGVMSLCIALSSCSLESRHVNLRPPEGPSPVLLDAMISAIEVVSIMVCDSRIGPECSLGLSLYVFLKAVKIHTVSYH